MTAESSWVYIMYGKLG